jgi:preprotein translocase subunit SecE
MASLANFFPIRYLRESRDELKKVTWPTQKQTLTYTGFVIGLCLVLAVYLGGLDYLLTLGLEALVKLTS